MQVRRWWLLICEYESLLLCRTPIVSIASEFYISGGRVLLVDQVFKCPSWKEDLLRALSDFRTSHHLRPLEALGEEDYPELRGILKVYDVKDSLSEYLNYKKWVAIGALLVGRHYTQPPAFGG